MSERDPEGLDVARMVARAAQGAPLPPPTTPKPRRRQQPNQTRARNDDPQPLGEALDELINARGWSTEVNLHHLLGRWPALVGPVNADHSHPEHYAAGVLTVRTDSTAWATSMRMIAPQLVAKLNEQLGQGTVTRVVVKGPEAPSWKHGRRSVSDGRGPRDTYG